MTLVVFSDGVLYADDCMARESNTRYQYHYSGEKIIRDEKGYLAIGFCGDVPHVSDFPKIISVMTKLGRAFSLRDKTPADKTEELKGLDSLIADLQKDIPGRSGETWLSIYCITREHAWFLGGVPSEPLTLFYNDVDHSTGSGKSGLNMCRANGMTVPEAYALLTKVESTVGKNVTMVKMKDLKPFVFHKGEV